MSNQEILNTQEKREYVLKIAEKLYHNNKAKNEELLYLLMQRLLHDTKSVRKQFVEKLMKKLFVAIEPSRVDVMERFLTRYYRDEDGKLQEEKKKIKEIVSQDKSINDYWETNGKKLLTHQGIMKCADFVEVRFGSPDNIDKPNSNNDHGFYMVVEASSENRIPTFGVGSANTKNATGNISGSFKLEMAHKRAIGRAFLTHVGLHDVYSSEEADAWSMEETLKKQVEQQKKQVQQVIQQGLAEQKRLNQLLLDKEGEVQRRNGFIDRMLEYVSLPEEDEKYPNVRISTIIEKEDYEYVEQLKMHKDKNIAYTAKRLLALHSATIEEKEKIEQIQAAGMNEVTEEKDEKHVQEVIEKEEEETKVVSTHKQVEVDKAKPFTLEPISEEVVEEDEPIHQEESDEKIFELESMKSEEVVKKEVTTHTEETENVETPKLFELEGIKEEDKFTTVDFTLDEQDETKED